MTTVYLCQFKCKKHMRDYNIVLWTTNVADYIEFMNTRNHKYYTELGSADFVGNIEEAREELSPSREIIVAALQTTITKDVMNDEYTAETRVHVPMTKFEYDMIMGRKDMLKVMCNNASNDFTKAYNLASPELKEALEIYNFDAYMSGFFSDWYNVDMLQIFLEEYGYLLKVD